jgi:hypothetical protein
MPEGTQKFEAKLTGHGARREGAAKRRRSVWEASEYHDVGHTKRSSGS